MRIASLGVARPVYYDRNASISTLGYSAFGLAPHAETIRATATIAAGKKAFVDATSLSNIRVTAATTASVVYCYAAHTPSGGSAAVYLLNPIISNTVGTPNTIAVGQTIAVLAGDQIGIGTSDDSTGGTQAYYIYAHYVTFDA